MAPETTGIGAGIDSFYEYALKWYILSGAPTSGFVEHLTERRVQVTLNFWTSGMTLTQQSCAIQGLQMDFG
jgi:hypothetical protein